MKMKLFTLALMALSSTFANAYLVDGVYEGINTKTNRKCKIEIEYEGDYLMVGRTEYRLTPHTPSRFIRCDDKMGKVYPKCISGGQTNGRQERSLFMLLTADNKIDRIYFDDGDFNSLNDKECEAFERID